MVNTRIKWILLDRRICTKYQLYAVERRLIWISEIKFVLVLFFFPVAMNDLSNFLLELGGFLRDYGCPYRNLVSSENRLNDRQSRLQLVDFLITEIQAAKMNKSLNRETLTNGTNHSTDEKKVSIFL